MSIELDWQFEDEHRREDAPEQSPDPRNRRWTKWLLAIAALVVIGGVALVIYQRSRQRLLVEAERRVQSVAELELQAAAAKDAELFRALQVADDSVAWRGVQEEWVAEGDLLPPPLPTLTTTGWISVADARVVGQRARVTMLRQAGRAGHQPVLFEAVRFYRWDEGDRQWLHAPLDANYAGHTIIWMGEHVVLNGYRADIDAIEPVAADLEGVAREFCSRVVCSHAEPMKLVLTGTLVSGDPDGGPLFAPLLVGRPVGEDAHDVWRSALQDVLLDRLMAREFGPVVAGEGGALVRRRAQEWLRAELALAPPVDLSTDALRRLTGSWGWIPLSMLWTFAGDEAGVDQSLAEAEADLLFRFIVDTYDAETMTAFLIELMSASSLEVAVEEGLAVPWSDFESGYADYVQAETHLRFQVRDATYRRVARLVGYDAVVACRGATNLWGLRLDQTDLVPLAAAPGLRLVAWSPDGTQVLAHRVTAQSRRVDLLRTEIPGSREIGSIPDEAQPLGWSPAGSYIVYSALGRSSEGGFVDVMSGASLDLQAQFLQWSPDGTGLVYVTLGDTPQIWRALYDGFSRQPLVEGYQVSWSPAGDRIAFLSAEPVLALYERGSIGEIVGRAQLERAFGAPLDRLLASADLLTWSPTGRWIALGLNRVDEGGAKQGGVLLVRPTGDDLQTLWRGGQSVDALVWSPDGRWLAFGLASADTLTTVVVTVAGDVLAQEEGEFAWSPDGAYLAVHGRDGVRLFDVLLDVWYRYRPAAACVSLTWEPSGPHHEPTANARSW